jgi:hypothetical protein
MSSKKPKVAKLQLKPTTVSTGYGSGTYDPSTGNVSYNLDPQLAEFRDYFYGAAEQFQPTQEEMDYAYDLGQTGQSFLDRGLGLDINKVTQDYYDTGSRLLAPTRAQEESRLADTLFKTGRTGAAVGRGEGYVNPEQFALLKAREEADASRMYGAEERARGIQSQDIQRGLGLIDSSNSLAMRPYSNVSSLFNLGAGIEGLGYNVLNTVGSFAPIQANWQQALQSNQQQINNAKASGSGFGSGLLGSAINAGIGYATGGWGGAVGGFLGVPGLGGQPGFAGGSFGNLFSGSSPSSSIFGSSGFGNLVGTWNNTYSPSATGIGMGGYNAPANFGGGTIGPNYSVF